MSDDSVRAVHSQEALFAELQSVEEAFLRQKSKVKWLKESDQHTQFFHKVVKGHATKHGISSLCCDDGLVTADISKIKAEILGFYEDLL